MLLLNCSSFLRLLQYYFILCLQEIEPALEPDVKSESNFGQRIGRLFLLSLGHVPLTDDRGCQQDSARMTELYRLYSADVPGVLDIKWCDGIYGQEESGLPLFAAADANGDLSLWSVNRTETTGEAECHLLEILSAEDGGSLALSLDWSTVLCRRYVTDGLQNINPFRFKLFAF